MHVSRASEKLYAYECRGVVEKKITYTEMLLRVDEKNNIFIDRVAGNNTFGSIRVRVCLSPVCHSPV